MDRIGVVGISWRQGGPEALAQMTIPVDERPERVPGLFAQSGVSELVYLATCNRVEVVFAGDGHTPLAAYRPLVFKALAGRDPEPGEAERTLRAWAGEGAVEHLFMVAAGLDSARVGETEITGQVKEAWELCRSLELTGARTDRVLEAALKVASRVRQDTAIGQGRTSLAEIALDHARERLRSTPGPAALIGVSPMTERCGKALAEEGIEIVVANRSADKAETLATVISGVGRSLDAFRAAPDPVEVVISATGSPDPVLSRGDLERLAARVPSGTPPLIIDLAVPPDIAPKDAEAAGLERFGMEEVLAEADAHRARRVREAADARAVIDEALLSFRRRMTEWLLAPMLAALQQRYRDTAVEGVERLLNKQLKGLGDDERDAVREWALTLARRFAHVPTKGLRGVAHDIGLGAVETFFREGDRQLAEALAETLENGDGAAIKPERVALADDENA